MTSNGYPLFHYISFILYPLPRWHEIHSLKTLLKFPIDWPSASIESKDKNEGIVGLASKTHKN